MLAAGNISVILFVYPERFVVVVVLSDGRKAFSLLICLEVTKFVLLSFLKRAQVILCFLSIVK